MADVLGLGGAPLQVDAVVRTPLSILIGSLAWAWGWGMLYTGVMTTIHYDFDLVAVIKETPQIVFWFVHLPYAWYNAAQVTSVLKVVGNGGNALGKLTVPEECGGLYAFFNNLTAGPTYCRVVSTLNKMKASSPNEKLDAGEILQCARAE